MANMETGNSVGMIITMVVAVAVAIMVMIFVGSLGGQTYNLVENDLDAIGNNVIVLESFIPLNSTAVGLNHRDIHPGFLAFQNSTGRVVGLGNFTVDYDLGKITLLNNDYNGTTLSVNYTWGAEEVGESAKSGIVSGFSALESTGNYLPIIVLAIIIAIVLTLIIGSSIGQITYGRGGGSL